MERSGLDVQLSEEQALLRDTVRSFAAEQIAPRHEALDHAGVHPAEIAAGMAELGLFGILAPADLGGVGMGMLAHAVAVEELGSAGGLAGAILCAHGIGLDALASAPAGTSAASALLAAGSFAAPAFEAQPGAPALVADGSGAEARLTGAKPQVPFPGRAGAYVVLATGAGGSALWLVEPGAAGVTHRHDEKALGLLGFETGQLVLKATPAKRLGGDDAVARAFASARIQVAALLCGIGRGAVAHAVRYAHERKQFDKLLIEFVAMQERLARAAARVEAARGLAHAAARLRDLGEPCAVAAAQARLVAGDAALTAADDGLQVFGGYGYSREYPAERYYRDARFLGFGEADPAALIGEIARNLG
jgi:alkylation response protein AidB-like acyl-CoA dehydrogenase